MRLVSPKNELSRTEEKEGWEVNELFSPPWVWRDGHGSFLQFGIWGRPLFHRHVQGWPERAVRYFRRAGRGP